MKVTRTAIFFLFLFAVQLSTAQTPIKSSKSTLAVLPLVNIKTGNSLMILSEKLRARLSKLPDLEVISKDKQEKILKEYNKDINTSCNSKECGFELGGLFQTDFILFGTASQFEGLGLVTVKILNVKTSKIVWSRVLTSKRSQASIEGTFTTIYKELLTMDLKSIQEGNNDILAVMDFSDSSFQAKILFERILTHAYKFGYSDVMSPEEVASMVEALGVEKDAVLNSIETLGKIGEKLGVQGVLYTNLTQIGTYLKHQMALFNVTDKTVMLSMPPLPKAGFKEVLYMERHFFKTLEDMKN